MGTRNTTEDYGDGNWTNPRVQAENQSYLANQRQPVYAQPGYDQGPPTPHPAPYRYTDPYQPTPAQVAPASAWSPRRKPAFSLARRFAGVLLALLTLATGLTGATAYWAQTTLVDTQNFTAMTEPIAYDQDFQSSLATAVTDDIMASPTITTYLGDGNSTAWYGGVQNWLYDQTRGVVDTATQSLVTSEAYPDLWAQVIADTHAYNFSGEARPAILDFSAIYDSAGSSVTDATGLGIDTGTLPGRTVTLDTGQNIWPINSAINSFIALANLWQPLLFVAALAALVGFVLWPRNRFAYLAVIGFVGAGLLWLAGIMGGGASLTAGLQLPTSNTAVVFVQKLSEAITASFATYHNDVALKVLIAAAVLTLLAILSAILRLTARATTARTR